MLTTTQVRLRRYRMTRSVAVGGTAGSLFMFTFDLAARSGASLVQGVIVTACAAVALFAHLNAANLRQQAAAEPSLRRSLERRDKVMVLPQQGVLVQAQVLWPPDFVLPPLGVDPPAADAQPRCVHESAESVSLLVTGETVAWVCPDCFTQLSADWKRAA